MLKNLNAEQARKGMTDQQVADYIKISRVSYGVKKRTGKFIVPECAALCSLFKVNFEYLFAEEQSA